MEEVKGEDQVLMALRSFCGPRAIKKRESAYDVAEIFSPPRTTRRAIQRGLRGGWSLDIAEADKITGQKWDLTKEGDIKKAWGLFYRSRPKLLIASPPCTLFSSMQRIRKRR